MYSKLAANEEIRFEKMSENVVDKLEAKIYENTKN